MAECMECKVLPERPKVGRVSPLSTGVAYRPATPRAISSRAGVRSPRCSSHQREHEKAQRLARRVSRIEKVYGIDEEEQQALWAFQGERCGICGRKPALKGPNTDHDHACCPAGSSCGRCVRGMLCYFCNFELLKGYSLEQLRAAVEYLTDPPLARMRGGRPMYDTPNRSGLMSQDADRDVNGVA